MLLLLIQCRFIEVPLVVYVVNVVLVGVVMSVFGDDCVVVAVYDDVAVVVNAMSVY
jgi:hypothetical protein